MPSKFHLIYQLALMGAFDVLPQMVKTHGLVSRVGNRMHRKTVAAVSRMAKAYNGALYQDTPDRLILENVVIPYYQLDPDVRNIVFVGCDWYTAGYERLFAHKKFWTIDPDIAKAGFGAARHQIAPMRNLATLMAEGQADLVVCNGVIGWGLNDRDEAEASFEAAWRILRPGGHLIVGFNDRPPHIPFHPDELAALACFESFSFEPLAAHEYRVAHELCHVYRFYRKPVAGAYTAVNRSRAV